jgi:spermidine synthase
MINWRKIALRSLLVFIVVGVVGVVVWRNSTRAESAAISAKQSSDEQVLVESKESVYNNIYVYRTGTYLSMTFGHNQHLYEESRYNTADDRELPEPYTEFMTASLMYPKKINSILEIGTGGGRTAWYLHRFLPKVQITTVELDPAVVELSRKYFGIKDEPNFRVAARDGRMFLADSKDRYDVILIDAYRGPFAPFHMLTKEFYQIVKGHLAEGGVIAQNVEPSTMLFDSAVKTLYTVFPQVEFYDAGGTGTSSALTGSDVGNNVIAIAYDGEDRSSSDLSSMADKRQSEYGLRYDLRQMLPHRFLLKTVGASLDVVNQAGVATGGIDDKAKVLTDDFAPVESLKAIARHNQKWTFQGDPATQ